MLYTVPVQILKDLIILHIEMYLSFVKILMDSLANCHMLRGSVSALIPPAFEQPTCTLLWSCAGSNRQQGDQLGLTFWLSVSLRCALDGG
jgi:hypothetical protein